MPKKPEVHSRFIQRSTENKTQEVTLNFTIPSRLYTSADDSITRFRLPRVPAIVTTGEHLEHSWDFIIHIILIN